MEKINAEVFVTVAALGSYKRAADKLGYTQAGISYIISSMEEQAGMKFFEREYGGVRLTREGKELLPSMQIVSSDKLEIIPLGRQEDMLVVAIDHPLAKKKVFPIKELKDHPYIGCSEELDSYNYDLARAFGTSLNQIMMVNNDYGCFAMISKGLGFGIYPKIMVENSMFPVRGIPFDVESYTDITVGFRAYESLSLAARAFIDFIRNWKF